MIDFSKIDFSQFDPAQLSELGTELDPSILGRLSFKHQMPTKPPFAPGRHLLGIAEERDTVLYVPKEYDRRRPVPLMVLFHGGGGSAEKILPFFEEHAEKRGFLILAPQSMVRSWDIVYGGHSVDLERLNQALTEVVAHYILDRSRFAFAGFSDGGSYTLTTGLTNGDIVSHLIVLSAGFMNVFMGQGTPRIYMAHGLSDEQLPIETSAHVHAKKLQDAGYDLKFVEFEGNHAIQPHLVTEAVDFFMAKKPGSR